MLALIEFRRSTSAEWSAYNPVLGPGEPGLDTTLNVLKIGDGVTAWAALPVFATGETPADGSVSQILWTDIGNVPDTFPPSPHTHPTSDIVSLLEYIQDSLSTTLVAGSGVTLTYNDTAGTLTVAATGSGGSTDVEVVRDTIGSALVGSGLITVTPNDAADTITISTAASQNQSDAYLLARGNHTGTESADVLTDGSTNRLYSTAEKTKLAGIATAATANQTDAYLLSRTNQTGTQTSSTISDFSAAADARAQAWTKKVVTWATGSEPSLSGVPDGTLWVEYTP